MSVRRIPGAALAVAVLATISCEQPPTQPPMATDIATDAAQLEGTPVQRVARQTVGGLIFNDVNLSLLRNQACASCHVDSFGFSSANEAVNAGGAVQPGSINTRFGTRRTPTAAYTSFTPNLTFDADEQAWEGGAFWDGRATGARLGHAAAEQALFPFVNPVEMALPDTACVIYRIAAGSYVDTFVAAFGPAIKSIAFPASSDQQCAVEGTRLALSNADRSTVQKEYDHVGMAINSFENTKNVNRFTSKFDAYLEGKATLTPQELLGMKVFDGKKAGCNGCHRDTGRHAFFTDFGYDNLGVPANPQNPALLADPTFRDLGLGNTLHDPAFNGAVKAPTLRNLDKVGRPGAPKAYMHNGVFKTLDQVVHFYNTRDVLPRCESLANPQFGINCWPKPEVEENVNTEDLGNLGLTIDEEHALVAFMRTLNDGYFKR